MPRPRRDGNTPAAPRKHKFSDSFIKKLKPMAARAYAVWDMRQPGLACVVQPSGIGPSSLSIHSKAARAGTILATLQFPLLMRASWLAASCSRSLRAKTQLLKKSRARRKHVSCASA